MACINKNLKKKIKLKVLRLDKDSFKKTLGFDFYKFQDNLMEKILHWSSPDAYVKELKEVVKNDEMRQKLISKLKKSNDAKWLFEGIEETDKLGMISRAIAFKHIVANVKMQQDIINKTPGARDVDLHDKKGETIQIAANYTYLAIGRDIAIAMGVRPTKVSPALGNAFYMQLGKMQVEALAKLQRQTRSKKGSGQTNLLSIKKQGRTIINGEYNKDHTPIKGEGPVRQAETYAINLNFFSNGNKQEIEEALGKGSLEGINNTNNNLRNTMSFVSGVSNLFAPKFEHLPLNKREDQGKQTVETDGSVRIKPNKKDTEHLSPEGVKASFRWEKTLRSLAEGTMVVNQTALKALGTLRGFLGQLDYQGKGVRLRDIKNIAGLTPYQMHQIFGTFYHEFSSKDSEASDWGVSSSKTNPIINTLVGLDSFMNKNGVAKKLMNEIVVYTTTRFGFKNNVLNEQSDKPFARQVIEGLPVKYKIGGTQFGILVNGMSKNYGIPEADIVSGQNKNLEAVITKYDQIAQKDGDSLLQFMGELVNGEVELNGKKYKVPSIDNSVWGQLVLIENLSKIRAAQRSGQDVVSLAATIEVDAVGSGPTIQAMQSLGINEEPILKLFQMLGMTEESIAEIGPEKLANDFYGVFGNALNGTEIEGKIQKLVDLKLFSNERTIHKKAMMVVGYEAGSATAKHDVANELTKEVLKLGMEEGMTKEGLEFLKKQILIINPDLEIGNVKNGKDLVQTAGVQQAIHEYFYDNYTTELDEKVRLVLDEFLAKRKGKVRDFTETIQNNLRKDKKIITKMMPYAARVILNDPAHPDHNPYDMKEDFQEWAAKEKSNLKKYGIELTSRRIVLKDQAGVKNVPVQEKIFNMLTAIVNAVHSIDAGQFLFSHEATMAEIKKQIASKDTDNFTKEQLKISLGNKKKLMHDGNGADAYYTEVYQEEYHNQAIDAHKQYSIEVEIAKTALLSTDMEHQEQIDHAIELVAEAEARLDEQKESLELIQKNKRFKKGKFADYFTDSKIDATKLQEHDFGTEQVDTSTPARLKEQSPDVEMSKLEKAVRSGKDAYIDLEFSFDENPKNGQKEIYQIAAINSKGEEFVRNFYPTGEMAAKYSKAVEGKEYLSLKELESAEDAQPYSQEAVNQALDELNGHLNEDSLTAYAGFYADFKHIDNYENGRKLLSSRELIDAHKAALHKLGMVDNPKGSTQGEIANKLGVEQGTDSRTHEAMSDTKTLKELSGKLAKNDTRGSISAILNELGKTNEFLGDIVNKIDYDAQENSFDPRTRTLSLKKGANREAVGHEVTHAITLDYIASRKGQQSREYKKIKQAYKFTKNNIKYLKQKFANNPEILSSLEHIANDKENVGIAEFVALGATNTTFRQDLKSGSIIKAIKDFLKNAINRLLRRPKDMRVTNMVAEDMGQDLVKTIDKIIRDSVDFQDETSSGPQKKKQQTRGRTATEFTEKLGMPKQNSKPKQTTKEVRTILKELDWKPFNDPAMSNTMDAPILKSLEDINSYTRTILIESILENPTLRAMTKKLGEKMDEKLSKYPIYADNKNRATDLWEHSPLLQKMKTYLAPERSGDAYTLNKLQTSIANAEKHARQIESAQIKQINDLTRDLSKEAQEGVFHATTTVPFFHLLNDKSGIVNELLRSNNLKGDIETKIVELARESQIPKTHLQQIGELAQLLARKKGPKVISHKKTLPVYNLHSIGFSEHTLPYAQKILALQTMLAEPKAIEGFKELQKNPELFKTMAAVSAALKTAHDRVMVNDANKRMYKENLVKELLNEPLEMHAITKEDLANGHFAELNGWRIVRQPTTGYGIAVRNAKDITNQPGFGTTLSYNFADITVPKDKFIKADNYVTVYDRKGQPRRKLVLTQEEIDSIGEIRTPSDAIVRTYSQIAALEETESARKALMSAQFNKKLSTRKEENQFAEALKDMRIEEVPWAVSFNSKKDAIKWLAQNKEARYKYALVDNMTQFNNANEKIHLVRIDMKDQLMGFEDVVAFKDSVFFRNAMYTLRQVVKMTKLHMTVTNPAKIAGDTTSNVAIMLAMGVSPTSIISAFKHGPKRQREIAALQIEQIDLRMQIDATSSQTRKKKLRAQMREVKKKIAEHPYGMLLMEGMIQSISTEILDKDKSVIAGVQHDVEGLLNKYLALEDKEGKTDLNNAIAALLSKGINLETILTFIGKGTENRKVVGTLGKTLHNAGIGLKDIKANKDVAKYITEWMATPESGAVRVGSALVESVDITSRYALLQHLMKNKKMSKEEAVPKVLELFIDYKVNMPKELKYASDTGVLLFPSFWMRIQRSVYRLARQNPATVTAGMSLEALMDVHIPTIYDSFVGAKEHFFYTPQIDESTFFPTHIFDFVPK